jgi:Lrp/AsnC family leucine-responsive transcriptional regulator
MIVPAIHQFLEFCPHAMNDSSLSLTKQDLAIVRTLQRNARMKNAELAELAGMSTTACWNRTRYLEDIGLIRGYVALIDQEKLGLSDTVLIEVTLDRHEDEVLARFGEELAALPEVLDGKRQRIPS